jgi:soluble P-type ATPase
MFVQAVALDYDGTIATDGLMDPGVRDAIAQFRAGGGSVVIATGRILEELEQVTGDLHIVDAVVAENGAVIMLPAQGRMVTLGSAPPPSFVAALRGHGIPLRTGRCVIESEAAGAPTVLQTIRELELSYVLMFNRSRLMVLSAGISKATGLHEALRLLGRSEHNTVAIGDAENDHPLLAAAEHGVAVGWGSPALAAVADYLRHLATTRAAPGATGVRRRLTVGKTATGADVSLAIRGRNVLIVGDSQSGKSYLAGLLAEQLILQRYAVYVIDPEGDFRSLASLPGVVAVAQSGPSPNRALLDELLDHPELSVVISLYGMNPAEKQAAVAELLAYLETHRQQQGIPHRIFLDEAHYFVDHIDLRAAHNGEPAAYTLVTYRLEDLDPDIWAANPVLISTRLSTPGEVAVLAGQAGLSGPIEQYARTLDELHVGEALLLRGMDQEDAQPIRCRLAPRLTNHVRHRDKYVDIPVAASHAFIFTHDGIPTGDQARTLGEMAALLTRVPASVLAGHLRRRDLSNWIGDVFGDRVLAAQIRAEEARLSPDRLVNVAGALAYLINERYQS